MPSKASTKKSVIARRWINTHRVHSLVAILIIVGVVGILGVHFLGTSHADYGYHYFWASQSNNIHRSPNKNSIVNPDTPTLSVGWHAFLYQVQCKDADGEVSYKGSRNNYWIRLAYHDNDWVNAVYASGGNDNSPVPGIPIKTPRQLFYPC